jgi:hypothetical protein
MPHVDFYHQLVGRENRHVKLAMAFYLAQRVLAAFIGISRWRFADMLAACLSTHRPSAMAAAFLPFDSALGQ